MKFFMPIQLFVAALSSSLTKLNNSCKICFANLLPNNHQIFTNDCLLHSLCNVTKNINYPSYQNNTPDNKHN